MGLGRRLVFKRLLASARRKLLAWKVDSAVSRRERCLFWKFLLQWENSELLCCKERTFELD
jgi:hypothetical protein